MAVFSDFSHNFNLKNIQKLMRMPQGIIGGICAGIFLAILYWTYSNHKKRPVIYHMVKVGEGLDIPSSMYSVVEYGT